MKKFLLVAVLGIAGMVSAKDEVVSPTKSTLFNSILSKQNKKVKPMEGSCVTYYSSCGLAAQYCSNPQYDGQFNLKRGSDAIEANYCAQDAPYSNTSGLN